MIPKLVVPIPARSRCSIIVPSPTGAARSDGVIDSSTTSMRHVDQLVERHATAGSASVPPAAPLVAHAA